MSILKFTLYFCAFSALSTVSIAQSNDDNSILKSTSSTEKSAEIETKATTQPAVLVDENPHGYHPGGVKVVRLEAAPDVITVPAGAVSSFDQKFVYRHDQTAKTKVIEPPAQKEAAMPNKFKK